MNSNSNYHLLPVPYSASSQRAESMMMSFNGEQESKEGIYRQYDKGESDCKLYAKLLKQRDLKIHTLNDKVRKMERQLDQHKSSCQMMECELTFLKQKITEELTEQADNNYMLSAMASDLRRLVLKMFKFFENDSPAMHNLVAHLELLKRDDSQSINDADRAQKMLETLDFQVNEMVNSGALVSKMADQLNSSRCLKEEEYRKADQLEKEALRNQIARLISQYEPLVLDAQEFNKELATMKKQQQYTKGLLWASEKEKNSLVNQIFDIARKDYQVDFSIMNRAALIKLSLQLMSWAKDLQQDKLRLVQRIRHLESVEQSKYDQILKMLKKKEKQSMQERQQKQQKTGSESKTASKLKRMASFQHINI